MSIIRYSYTISTLSTWENYLSFEKYVFFYLCFGVDKIVGLLMTFQAGSDFWYGPKAKDRHIYLKTKLKGAIASKSVWFTIRSKVHKRNIKRIFSKIYVLLTLKLFLHLTLTCFISTISKVFTRQLHIEYFIFAASTHTLTTWLEGSIVPSRDRPLLLTINRQKISTEKL